MFGKWLIYKCLQYSVICIAIFAQTQHVYKILNFNYLQNKQRTRIYAYLYEPIPEVFRLSIYNLFPYQPNFKLLLTPPLFTFSYYITKSGIKFCIHKITFKKISCNSPFFVFFARQN